MTPFIDFVNISVELLAWGRSEAKEREGKYLTNDRTCFGGHLCRVYN